MMELKTKNFILDNLLDVINTLNTFFEEIFGMKNAAKPLFKPFLKNIIEKTHYSLCENSAFM